MDQTGARKCKRAGSVCIYAGVHAFALASDGTTGWVYCGLTVSIGIADGMSSACAQTCRCPSERSQRELSNGAWRLPNAYLYACLHACLYVRLYACLCAGRRLRRRRGVALRCAAQCICGTCNSAEESAFVLDGAPIVGLCLSCATHGVPDRTVVPVPCI